MPAREGPVYSPFRYDHLLTGIGTRRRNRTHVVGFGGRSSTIELDAHKKSRPLSESNARLGILMPTPPCGVSDFLCYHYTTRT